MENLTLFFSSRANIKEAAKELPNPKIGCTTAGEIDCALRNETVSMELDSNLFETRVIKVKRTDIPIIYSEEIIRCATDILQRKNKLICVVLNDGLSGDEERIQSFLHNILPEDTEIVGGSSGDDLNMEETYCCVDDDVFKGAGILLIGTNLKYYIKKENIYGNRKLKTNKALVVTKADNRILYELDGVSAAEKYSEVLNCNESEIEEKSFNNPFGTFNEGEIMICSCKRVLSDGSLELYKSVIPSNVLWVLDLLDYKSIMRETVKDILSRGTPVVTLTFSCILRSLLYKQDNSEDFVSNVLNKIKAFGFVCYAEQYKALQTNQTMVTLTFYKD